MFEWTTWLGTLAAFGIALIANLVLAIVIKLVMSSRNTRNHWFPILLASVHLRLQLLVLIVACWIVGSFTAPGTLTVWPLVSHLFAIVTVIAGAWLLSGLVSFGIERLVVRYDQKGEALPEVRRMRTQLILVRRLANVAIAVVAIGIVLFSFPEVRAVGTSVLASAGIVSVIAGLAAQSTLGNLIAGIQLAFSDSVRVGDVVVVEGEWGKIGEVTLSYVVVNVWDERRLILPCTYFTTQPFVNWTRRSDAILGIVYMDLDWRVPVQAAREKFDAFLAQSDLWDGRTSNVRVTGSQGGFVTLRFVASAKNSDDQWLLMCEVREEMVTWVREEHPEALPTTRVELTERDQGEVPDRT